MYEAGFLLSEFDRLNREGGSVDDAFGEGREAGQEAEEGEPDDSNNDELGEGDGAVGLEKEGGRNFADQGQLTCNDEGKEGGSQGGQVLGSHLGHEEDSDQGVEGAKADVDGAQRG